jgi:hypothetical protein
MESSINNGFVKKLKLYLKDEEIMEELTVSLQDKWGRLRRDTQDIKNFIDNYIEDCPDTIIKLALQKKLYKYDFNTLISLSAETDYEWEIEMIKRLMQDTISTCEEKIQERKNHFKRINFKKA